MTILIAPATSRTNSYVIDALLSQDPKVSLRLLCHSSKSDSAVKEKYKAYSSVSTVVADFLDPPILESAMTDVNALFLNLPLSKNSVQAGKNAIDAAKKKGVERVVFCSVLHPFIQGMRHHRQKLDVEEYLFESGLNYTILEPTHLMQNIPLSQAIQTGSLPLPYATTVLQGFLDIPDLAQISATILLSPTPSDHYFARYELTGSNATYEDVAKVISEAAGKEVKCARVGKDELAKRIGAGDEWTNETLRIMLEYYETRGIPGNTNTTRWLLGREPAKWKDVVEREMKAIQGQ
ncbi:NAD-P-binding protein [Stereum hirsutum FP-91666 SS1]|uniref:NAD-P-binding protein n=1 Tax=Stereum hirsutum (strain FP-91666) TaxID=721885 RepID=UPI000440F992|nr:NAD-P-binding protein [Stereum hirsutum FP-91666 SS1]EIM89325.1 NAD-P-binding protein [Stereum hirsutum FP-91666 SS1]